MRFRMLVEMFQDRVMQDLMNSVLHCDRAMAEDLSQEGLSARAQGAARV